MIRGIVEGFYGPPWTHDERLDLLEFCGREGLTTWVHAPKDDPFHRAQWRDLYPDAQLARLAELARHAEANGVEFVWTIAPGLSIRLKDDSDLAALDAKRAQLLSIGVADVQLLWDDIEREWISAADQAEITNRFKPRVVCPMGYAGSERTPYRDTFGSLLDPEVVVYWTGPEVVSKEITREQLDGAADAFGHELLVWDNYPVNDWDKNVLFLGPLRNRDPQILAGRCAGLIANAMVQAVPSKLALATVADWLRQGEAYDPLVSFERALKEYGSEVVEALGPANEAVPPADLEALVDALAPGVDAGTGAALLAPFV